MFTEKLSRKSRVVPPAVSPYTVSLLINILLYWCDNTLLLQFQVHIRVPFSYCTFCRFWQMYDNIYPSLQYCKNPLYSMYWALSFLWAPKNHWFFFFPSVFSYFLCSWCFSIWGLAEQEKTALPRAGQFLEMAHGSPASTPPTCKWMNPEPKAPLLSGS